MTDDKRTAGRFVHLHNHTEYSALDGIARITDAAAAAAADGQPAMAITDHGTLAGTAAFVRVAKAAGVKPVLGIEAYTAIGSRLERNALAVLDDDTEADADADARGKRGPRTKTKRYGHLTLLARNPTGWRNLVAMHNRSQQDESYWYKPRIDMELLTAHADGITALSGCLGGDVAGNVLRGRPDAAATALNTLGDILGPENVHVELMDHGIPAERAVLPGLLELAREFAKRRPRGSRRQVPVATNDCHHTRADDAVAHDAWLAVGTKSVLRDTDRFHFDGTGYHVRTAAEMRGLAAELGPDWADVWNLACDNTLAVAERVDADVLPPFRLRLPLFDTPEGSTVEEHFLAQVRAGAHRRYGPVLPRAVRERLNLEYRVIAEKGFLGYFLIVADLIGWARSQGILVGPGRGSSAGSLSALCLGIVNVDPLEHRLLFERFMAPDRADMPDIDIDFDPAHDDEVLAYLTRRYGTDRVARIGTLGRSRSRRAILDSARVLELADAGAALAKAVPVAMGKPMPLAQMLDGDDPAADQFRELAARPDEARVLDLAVRMEGVAASPGIHACGVLISDEPMTDLVPLRRDRKDDGRGGWVTEWEAPDLEKAGFLKLDTLMLRNLRVVQLCVRMVADRLGVDVDVDRLPTAMSDPTAAATWDLLRRGNTAQVFQLDSGGMRDLVAAVGPESLGDLSAVMALYRPGPMGAGMHLHYAARKRGDEPVDYGIFTADPAEQKVIAEVLGDTFGVPVYQEQLMQLGEHVAGFGPVERSRLRVAVSKKKAAEMAVVGELFVAGAQREMRDADRAVTKRAFAAATARALWAAIESAGEYSFNRCLAGDTVLQTGSNYQWTVGELHRKLHTIDWCGPTCCWCGKRPPVRRGLCSGCYAWHTKFRSPRSGLSLLAYDFEDGRIRPKRVRDVHFNGYREVFRLTLDNEMSVKATANHRFLSAEGIWRTVDELRVGDALAVDGGYETHRYAPGVYRTTTGPRQGTGWRYGLGENNTGYVDGGFVALKEWTKKTSAQAVCARPGPHAGRLERAHLDGDRANNNASNLEWMCVSHHKAHDYRTNNRHRRWEKGHRVDAAMIVSIEETGIEPVYDVEMDDEGHNFTANGIVSHNSHSVAYGAIAYITAYLKANYPAEYSAAVLTCTKDADKRQSVLLSLAADGVQVLGPSVNDGLVSTGVTAEGLVRLGTGEIKGVSSSAVAAIHAERAAGGPFTSLRDMLDRVRTRTDDAAREPDDDPDTADPDDEPGKPAAGRLPVSVVEGLIEAGALDDFGPRLGLMMTARSIRAADLPVPDAEWGVVEASRRERERTGVSLTRRPLVDLRGQVSAYRWRAEDDYGVPLGGRPLPVHRLPQIDRAPTLTVGVVTEWGERAYRGGWMAKFTLEGSRGATSGVMWNDTLESLRRADRVPGVGDVVCVRGRVVHREVTVTVSDPDAEGGETQQVETRLELMAHDVRAVPLDDPSRVVLPAGPLPRLQLVADTPTGAQFVRQLDTTDAPPPVRSAAVPPAITAGASVDDFAAPLSVAARRPGGPEVLAVFLTPGSSLWLSVGRRERSLLTGLLPALSSPKTAAQLAALDGGQWTQPLVTTNPNLRVVFVACDSTADDALVRLAPADAHAALGPGMTACQQDPTLELVPAGDDPTVTADAWAPGDPFPGEMVLFEVPGLDVDTELVLRFDPGHVGNRPVAA